MEQRVTLTCEVLIDGRAYLWLTLPSKHADAGSGLVRGMQRADAYCGFSDSWEADGARVVVRVASGVIVFRLTADALRAAIQGLIMVLRNVLGDTRTRVTLEGRRVLRKKRFTLVMGPGAVSHVLRTTLYGGYMGTTGCQCSPGGRICQGCSRMALSVDVAYFIA